MKKYYAGLLLVMLLWLSGCSPTKEVDNDVVPSIKVEDHLETKEEVYTVDLLAVGDNLIHTGIFKSGVQSDGSYNFDHLYANVADDIKAADLAIVNQETIYTYDRNNYSGYPCFGSPVEIGDALVEAGFDVVLHATNHTFDQGSKSVKDTIDFWKTNHSDITVLGINESEEEADQIEIVECNGIKFAMLNYAANLNGFVLPQDKSYMVNILDKDRVKAQVEEAKEKSDCVVFFLHCGDEYVYQPSAETKEWVDYLSELGVDITIASHPHVLEPYGEVVNSEGKRMVVYYSMGNFISTQDAMPRMIGGMAKLKIQKTVVDGESKVEVLDYTLDPLFTHYNHNTKVYTVYKLSEYTDEMATKHGLYNTVSGGLTVDKIQAVFDEIMNTQVD